MKRFNLLLIMAFQADLVSIVYARETISPEDAAKFIGREEIVCGNVASAHFAAASKARPTFLNLGKPYPNQARSDCQSLRQPSGS